MERMGGRRGEERRRDERSRGKQIERERRKERGMEGVSAGGRGRWRPHNYDEEFQMWIEAKRGKDQIRQY